MKQGPSVPETSAWLCWCSQGLLWGQRASCADLRLCPPGLPRAAPLPRASPLAAQFLTRHLGVLGGHTGGRFDGITEAGAFAWAKPVSLIDTCLLGVGEASQGPPYFLAAFLISSLLVTPRPVSAFWTWPVPKRRCSFPCSHSALAPSSCHPPVQGARGPACAAFSGPAGSWRPELPPPQGPSVPAAARWVTKKRKHKNQPLERRVVSVSRSQMTHVLETGGAGWEREAGGSPGVGFV